MHEVSTTHSIPAFLALFSLYAVIASRVLPFSRVVFHVIHQALEEPKRLVVPDGLSHAAKISEPFLLRDPTIPVEVIRADEFPDSSEERLVCRGIGQLLR